MEFEAYAEPKALSSEVLVRLRAQYGSYYAVADLIGASEAFVRQKAQRKAYRRSNGKVRSRRKEVVRKSGKDA